MRAIERDLRVGQAARAVEACSRDPGCWAWKDSAYRDALECWPIDALQYAIALNTGVLTMEDTMIAKIRDCLILVFRAGAGLVGRRGRDRLKRWHSAPSTTSNPCRPSLSECLTLLGQRLGAFFVEGRRGAGTCAIIRTATVSCRAADRRSIEHEGSPVVPVSSCRSACSRGSSAVCSSTSRGPPSKPLISAS